MRHNLIRHAETPSRSNRKHRDGREGDTDSRKYKNNRPRGNRDYISYSCRHSTINHITTYATSIPINTIWGTLPAPRGTSATAMSKITPETQIKMQETSSIS